MHFKNPEILYFLFLLVIPILVHLFQLRRFKKQLFTNVRFLKELSVQTRKSSKIKKWLLLFTRLFLLACLIFAFAQPFFKANDSEGTSNELFIVLDNSFSMQAKGKNGELLKRAVEDLLTHVPPERNFTLITNDNTYWNTDIRSVRNDLQNLSYSGVAFRPDAALATINSRKSNYNKDVVFISDGLGVGSSQLAGLDPAYNTFFVTPEAEQRSNTAVDSAYINNITDNFYELTINLSAYGELASEMPIALYNHQKLVGKTVANFDSAQKSVTFTIPKEDFQGFAEITDNGLPYDNRLYFSISKPKKSRVLSIGRADKSNFLSKIYTSREFDYTNSELRSLDYNAIDLNDVVLLNELEEIPQALQTTLKAFVDKGGSVILVPSAENNQSNLNAFLSVFGNLQFGALVDAKKPITRISFSHPLFSGVFEKKIDNFQYPTTTKSFMLQGNYPWVLAYEDQSKFLTAIPNSTSNVYVFAAPISKENSNFQNSPLIVPTFYNMAQASTNTGIHAHKIGSGQSLIIEAALGKDEIVTVLNEDENFIPVQQLLSNRIKLSFIDQPKKAGNFGIFKGNDVIQNVSFNYARTESDLDQENQLLLSDYNIVESVATLFDTLHQERTDNNLWKLFLILALLFLITELLIQKLVK